VILFRVNIMNNKFHSLNGQSGFSLVELLVVIVIIAVVASLAFFRMGKANTQFQRQNVARELKVVLERARFDSVKRNAEGAGPATVIVRSTSYTLNTDSDRNGAYETLTTDFAAQNIAISGFSSMTLPVTITFDKRGEAEAVDSSDAVVNPQFYVCNSTCSVTPTVTDADLVMVTRTGTVSLVTPEIGPPVFGNANITNTTVYTGSSVRLP
jgi:prepilin-type N-terminal cleavage/methylation domain-containing protein